MPGRLAALVYVSYITEGNNFFKIILLAFQSPLCLLFMCHFHSPSEANLFP